MTIREVNYVQVLDKRWDCIVAGEGIKLLDSSNIDAQLIIDKIPLPFNEINDFTKKFLDEISYIEFWSNVKIYRHYL
jgi:hypothetical protein